MEMGKAGGVRESCWERMDRFGDMGIIGLISGFAVVI